MKRVLFVCTGNICRSPMADGLFRELAAGGPDLHISSAGLAASPGCPPSENAVAVMQELDIDISGMRSRPLTAQLVADADCIYVMTYAHLDHLLMLHPDSADKSALLRQYTGGKQLADHEIADPIGQSIEVYRDCRDQINDALPSLLRRLLTP